MNSYEIALTASSTDTSVVDGPVVWVISSLNLANLKALLCREKLMVRDGGPVSHIDLLPNGSSFEFELPQQLKDFTSHASMATTA